MLAIQQNKFLKVLALFLIFTLILFSFQVAQPVKTYAFAQVLLLQAFGALVGVVLTAVVGYTLADDWNLSINQLDSLYNKVMDKLSTSDQADFIAALTTFMATGQITSNLLPDLFLGIIGNEVIGQLQADTTQMQGNFSQETLTLMETELDAIIASNTYSYCWADVKYLGYQNYNERYLIGIKAGTTATAGMMTDAMNMVGFNVMNDMYNGYPGFLMTFEKLTTAYVSSGAYTYPNRRVGVAIVMMDTWYDDVVYSGTSLCYATAISPWNIAPWSIIEGSQYTNGLYQYAAPWYNFNSDYVFDVDIGYLPTVPGITDIDLGSIDIPVPVDTAIDIPAFPQNPTGDTTIIINIPVPAEGEGVTDVPIDPVGTAVPDAELPIDGIPSTLDELLARILQWIISFIVPSDTYWVDTFNGFRNDLELKLGYSPDRLNTVRNLTGQDMTDITVQIPWANNAGGVIVNFSDAWNEYKDYFRSLINGALAIFLVMYNYNQIYFMIRGTYPMPQGKGGSAKGRKEGAN